MRLFDLSQNQVPDILRLVSAEDKVLLRQEAVYLMKTTQLHLLPCTLHCLATDAAARGVIISEPFTALHDSQWLDLVLQTKQIL